MDGVMAFAIILLLFPAYQSLSHVISIPYWSSHNTKVASLIQGISGVVNIPMSYFALAPKDAWLPGFGLGALGLAVVVVINQIITVNIMIWWISRHYGWKFDWAYQVVGLGGALLLGSLSYYSIVFAVDYLSMNLFFQVLSSFLLFAVLVSISIWFFPSLAGLKRSDLTYFFKNRSWKTNT